LLSQCLLLAFFGVVEVGQEAGALRLVEGAEDDLDAYSPKYKQAPGFLSAYSLSKSSSGWIAANPDIFEFCPDSWSLGISGKCFPRHENCEAAPGERLSKSEHHLVIAILT
jgi:hypothetical protein